MGDVINLRRERKQRVRSEKEEQAAANRAKFGRTKTEREAGVKRGQLEERRHEAHRRTPPRPEDGSVESGDGEDRE